VSLDDQGMKLKLKITDELGFEFEIEKNSTEELIEEIKSWIESNDETPIYSIEILINH
jgi:hypothetical protein